MNINLKQPEIIIALQQYLVQQGLSLKNKDVVIKFTAGRGETGISADVVIESNELPDFVSNAFEEETSAVKPCLTLVADKTKEPEPDKVPNTELQENIAVVKEITFPEPTEEEQAEEIVTVMAKPVRTTSLFN